MTSGYFIRIYPSESDSHSRRYPDLFEFLHYEILCQVTPPVRFAHRRCRSGASAPKDIRHIVFTVRSTLSVPFSIAVVSPHLPLRRQGKVRASFPANSAKPVPLAVVSLD